MATSTTNLGLTKPAGTDKIRIAQINGNMDILDEKIGAVGNTSLQAQITSQNEAIANVQNGLANIVGNTNTTGSTLAVGQFVYVKGHSTIAEGLRKVTASISANASITTSNTTAVSGGGLNELNSNMVKKTDRVAIDRTTNSSCADCDALTDVGFYRVIDSTQNKPSGMSYGILLYMRSNDYNAQIVIATNGSMYCRGKGVGSTWTAWKTVSVS